VQCLKQLFEKEGETELDVVAKNGDFIVIIAVTQGIIEPQVER